MLSDIYMYVTTNIDKKRVKCYIFITSEKRLCKRC